MAQPFPKTIPRSTLACPPAKNFIDQFSKPTNQIAPPQQPLNTKASTAQISKKESEKEFPSKQSVKELPKSKFDNNNAGNDQRGSSKEGANNLKNPSHKEAVKKGNFITNKEAPNNS